MNRLVLLTGEYPYAYGDVNFVRHEIDAIAAAYDDVVVFNYARRTERLIDMPANVTYAGNLFDRNRWRVIGALLSPRSVQRLVQVLLAEHRGGRLAGHRRQAVLSSVQGMRIARHPRLRAALTDPSVLTSVYAFWGMGAALGLPWLPPARGRVAVRLHRFDLYEESGALPLRLALFASADRILTISDDGRRYLLSRFAGVADLDRKTRVSRLGTADHGRPALHGPVGIEDGRGERPTIVSCSSIIPVKRVERILDALTSRNPSEPLRWIHFGTGPIEEQLRAAAARVSIPGLEVELRGSVDNSELMRFYASEPVDAFLNVSESEGVPVSIMEAMSFDIPVIATAVGGTPEVVGPELGSGELLAPDFRDRDLTEALHRVLEAPDGHYSPRAVWEELCDARRNSAELVAMLTDASQPVEERPTPPTGE